MTTVKIIKQETGTYRVQIEGIIWYDYLRKDQIFDAMEETSIELGNQGIEHTFKFEL